MQWNIIVIRNNWIFNALIWQISSHLTAIYCSLIGALRKNDHCIWFWEKKNSMQKSLVWLVLMNQPGRSSLSRTSMHNQHRKKANLSKLKAWNFLYRITDRRSAFNDHQTKSKWAALTRRAGITHKQSLCCFCGHYRWFSISFDRIVRASTADVS